MDGWQGVCAGWAGAGSEQSIGKGRGGKGLRVGIGRY